MGSTPGVSGQDLGLKLEQEGTGSGAGVDRTQDQVPLEGQQEKRKREPELPLQEVGKSGLWEKSCQSRKKSGYR